MKDATGGALLMGLAAGIIMIFIIMVAFFISYGKTFKIKNEILNAIEQKEGMSLDELKTFVVGKTTTYSGKTIKACYDTVMNNGEVKGFIVKVVVYMKMDRNILGSAFNVEIPINGETRIIEKGVYLSDLNSLNLNKCDTYTPIVS